MLPATLRRRLGIRAGDALDVAVEHDRIVLSAARKPKFDAKIVKDPLTGFPVIDLGPDAPVLTSEMVHNLLVDFP